MPYDHALSCTYSKDFLPRHFDKAQGGQLPEDVDRYVGAAPLGDICFSIKSEIFHVDKEVTSKG